MCYNGYMRTFILLAATLLQLLAAKISLETGNKLQIEGYYFQDRCALVYIHLKVIGEENDGNESDVIAFHIYNDGKLIKTTFVSVPLEQAKDINLSIRLDNLEDKTSPGIAIESKELGIYIDPFKLKKMDMSCSDYLNASKAAKELGYLCPKLKIFGIKCE